MFEPIVEDRIPQSIVRQIKQLIASGRLNVGDRLPGERQLMQQLEVSRSSLREALQSLEATGFVKVIPGKGTYIQDPAEKSGVLMETMIWPWADQGGRALTEILEVRYMLETEAAQIAAERAKPDDLELIRSELDGLAKAHAIRRIDAMVSANIAFHRSIAQATGNSLMLILADSIQETLREFTSFAIRLSGGVPDSVVQHERIYQAIADHDPEAARAEVSRHLKRVREVLDLYLANVEADPEILNEKRG
jgi:GntR family transcriptional repressor for pyruvate dehydrogenase complex